MPFMGQQQQWPYYLTQGAEDFDPEQLPTQDLGLVSQASAPAPAPDALADAVGNGLPPGMDMKPAASPEEHAARKQGWLGAIGKMFSDPQTGDMLMRIGLQMMQPMKPGQTPGGHTAAAITGGLDYKEKRVAGDTESARKGAESTSKIALEKAHANYYNRAAKDGGRGGGTAAEVQKVNQIAAALRQKDPERYAAMPGQDILDARELLDAYKREQIAAGILKGTALPGVDIGETTDAAITQQKKIRESTAASLGGTKAPAASGIPAPADRKVGQVYDTPKGKMKWTGTGWTPAQ
jgi:hypothetical protein